VLVSGCVVSVKPTAIAIVICLIAATLEALLAGSGVRVRFGALRMPAYSPCFGIWILIGVLYYVMCFLILRRLLSTANSHPWALMLMIAILAGNAFWNALLFRWRALRASFLAFIPYAILVLALAPMMVPIYKLGTVLLIVYCSYLVYAAWWSYRLWRLNKPKRS
jgi:benzodiazapine receptor